MDPYGVDRPARHPQSCGCGARNVIFYFYGYIYCTITLPFGVVQGVPRSSKHSQSRIVGLASCVGRGFFSHHVQTPREGDHPSRALGRRTACRLSGAAGLRHRFAYVCEAPR